jgi:flavin-dependent dehydrogenase
VNKKLVEHRYLQVLAQLSEFFERICGARRETPFCRCGFTRFPRKPYGPRWLLIGGAGYNNDPITAKGNCRRLP